MARKTRILITLSEEATAILDTLMAEDIQTNRSSYIALVLGAEAKRRKEDKEGTQNRRGPGRPKKNSDEEDDELPDEHAPRTIPLPEKYRKYVILPDREKLLNEYDLVMLEEKVKHHGGNQAQ